MCGGMSSLCTERHCNSNAFIDQFGALDIKILENESVKVNLVEYLVPSSFINICLIIVGEK